MTRYYSAAETAKLVRAALKTQFPGVKFAIRASTYSMGSHVDVRWTDGPAQDAVERVTANYGGSGMTDNTDYTPTQYRTYRGEEVHFSDTRCQRDYSPELLNRIARRLFMRQRWETQPDECPTYGEYGWTGDFYTRYEWFSMRVYREARRTHVVSRAEMAGYVAPPIERIPLLREV